MKNLFTPSLMMIVMSIAITNSSYSQLGGAVLRKVTEKSNQLMNKDDKPQQQNDNSQNNNQANQPDNNQQDNPGQNRFAAGFQFGKAIPVEKNYQFESSITMDGYNYSSADKKETKMTYTIYFNTANQNFAAEFVVQSDQENGQTTMIGDYKNKAFIMLSSDDNQKTGIVSPIDTTQYPENDNTLTPEEQQKIANDLKSAFKKTGKTKVINGFQCDEYSVEDQETTASIWLSKQVDPTLWNAFNKISNRPTYYYLSNYGFVVDIEVRTKKTDDISRFTLREFNKNNRKNIDISDYQLISLPGNGN